MFVDILFFALLIYSIYNGCKYGFIRSLVSCVSWIIAWQISINYYQYIEKKLLYTFGSSIYLTILSQIALFIIVLSIFAFAAYLFSLIVNLLLLGFLDAIFGAMFGFLRGIVATVFCYYCIIAIINITHTQNYIFDNKSKPVMESYLPKSYVYNIIVIGQYFIWSNLSTNTKNSAMDIYNAASLDGIKIRFINVITDSMLQELGSQTEQKVKELKKRYATTMSEYELRLAIAKFVLNKYKEAIESGAITGKLNLDVMYNLNEILSAA